MAIEPGVQTGLILGRQTTQTYAGLSVLVIPDHGSMSQNQVRSGFQFQSNFNLLTQAETCRACDGHPIRADVGRAASQPAAVGTSHENRDLCSTAEISSPLLRHDIVS